MERIDAHQHYWDIDQVFPVDGMPWFLGAVTYGWRPAGLAALDRSLLPLDLEPALAAKGIAGTILVNAIHSLGETRWMLDLARRHRSIEGVVGWVNLAQPAELVAQDLDQFALDATLVGIRHLAQFEPDERWHLRPDVLAGLRVLAQRGVPYDLLLKPSQLGHVPELSEKLPDLNMVVDHLAKPDIKHGTLEPWARDIRRAARNPRLFCKLSGMITEADHQRWTPADLTPYVETVLEAFGTDRVMYGSDWPVCTLAASYDRVYDALLDNLRRILGDLDGETERAIFRDNALRFYRRGSASGPAASAALGPVR